MFCVQLDLDSSLEEQGPFDLIFHKLTDQLAKAQQGNTKARKQIERFHVSVLCITIICVNWDDPTINSTSSICVAL